MFVVYDFSKQGNTVAKFCKRDGRCSNATAIETRRSAFKTSNGGLPPEDGSDRRETLPKRVSGDSRRFILRRRKQFDFENLSKFRTVVYPLRMTPIGAKLCQNAFQTILNVSFFDARNNFVSKTIANFEGPFTPRGWLRLT